MSTHKETGAAELAITTGQIRITRAPGQLGSAVAEFCAVNVNILLPLSWVILDRGILKLA